MHCRASAAIPFVFPAVAIAGRWHVDGGLRQNTPLRPVLSAGVDRALIVGVKQDREDEARSRAEALECLLPNRRVEVNFVTLRAP